MIKISLVIITYNASNTLERCLNSVEGIVDEIVVVDSFSTDNTAEICGKFGTIFVQNKFTGFMDQRNFALKFASNDFVLTLDADEALSEELKKSILAVKENFNADGYVINRLNNFCGQWIRHTGLYPDSHIRLYNKGKGSWGPNNVHETFMMDLGTKVEHLKGDILHYACSTVEEYTKRVDAYTLRYAQEYFKSGKKVSIIAPYLHGGWRFILNYVIRLGFLDGRNGFVVSKIGARSSFRKYKLLRQMWSDSEKA